MFVSIGEAARLAGRSKVNVYKWARLGYVKSELVVQNERQKVGKLLFDADDVVRVSGLLFQGFRSDVLPLEDGGRFEFTAEQLAVAERVLR